MTKEEIIAMAKQAGVRDDEHTFEFSQYKYLERFAKLVFDWAYIAPSTWVGLTDEDLQGICDKWQIYNGEWMNVFVGDIEAKLKERNR
jgi:hypothetical protein